MSPLGITYWKLRQFQKEGIEVYYQGVILKNMYHDVSEYDDESIIIHPQCGNNLSNPAFQSILSSISHQLDNTIIDQTVYNVILNDNRFQREVQDIEFFFVKDDATISLFGFSRDNMMQNLLPYSKEVKLEGTPLSNNALNCHLMILVSVFELIETVGFKNSQGYMPQIYLYESQL